MTTQPSLRLQFLRRTACRDQGGLCFYCGRPMMKPTAEHLIARKDGGQDTRANVVAACLECNHARHADERCSKMPIDVYGLFRLLIAESEAI